jgi:hypothetical protein
VQYGALLLVFLCTSAAGAGTGTGTGTDDDDSAALALPVDAQTMTRTTRPLSLTTESALTEASQRSGGTMTAERWSLGFRYDARLNASVRTMFADLLDLEWSRSFGSSQHINTFKEGYVSWQPGNDVLMDAGRINARQGVALGYNPTDFFREGALRTIDSLDPNSLRQNRMGTVMLRAETLWDSGAFTVSYAPRLADGPSSQPWDPDLGATNNRSRWSLAFTQHLSADLAPQWMLFGNGRGSTLFGLNVTYVLGAGTVAYVEASGGRQPSLWAQAQNAPDDASLRSRAAAGVTYSTANKMSFTLEYEYNGAGLGRSEWTAARAGSGAAYGRYRELASLQQDPVTQHSAFLYATWQDSLVRHLDVSAFLRVDLLDHSCLPWTELRHHWSRIDAALQWQAYHGGATSAFGASATRQSWQALVDFYL